MRKVISKGAPWMTKGLLITSSVKLKLFKKKIAKSTWHNCDIYLSYKKLYNTICWRANNITIPHFLLNAKMTVKTWQLINNAIGRPLKKGELLPKFFNEKVHFGRPVMVLKSSTRSTEIRIFPDIQFSTGIEVFFKFAYFSDLKS